MAEELSNLLRNFSLLGQESVGVKAIEHGMNELVLRGKSCIVGKLFSDRNIGKDSIKPTLI
jgi:hypothetical protein